MSAPTCAYCGRPATTYHVPPLVNGRMMAKIPICGGKCNFPKRAAKNLPIKP